MATPSLLSSAITTALGTLRRAQAEKSVSAGFTAAQRDKRTHHGSLLVPAEQFDTGIGFSPGGTFPGD